jgi:hypothetical protein
MTSDTLIFYALENCRLQLEALKTTTPGMRRVVSMSLGGDAVATEKDPEGREASIQLERYMDDWYATGEVLLFAASGNNAWGNVSKGGFENPALYTNVSRAPFSRVPRAQTAPLPARRTTRRNSLAAPGLGPQRGNMLPVACQSATPTCLPGAGHQRGGDQAGAQPGQGGLQHLQPLCPAVCAWRFHPQHPGE